MNGCNFNPVTRNPLNAPNTAPTARPATIAAQGLMPLTAIDAVTIPVIANVQPIDRSIPPVIIANMIPAANTPFNTIC